MADFDYASLEALGSTLNYVTSDGARPAFWLYQPTPGEPPPRPDMLRESVTIRDARPVAGELTLDRHGFALVHDPLPELDWLDADAVREEYYPRVRELVRRSTGATRVEIFDHNVRNKALSTEPNPGVREPVRFVHNDYTERSGPQRIRDLFGAEAEALLETHYAFINVWRPLRGPVVDAPLAVCDATSMVPEDFVATDLKYEDRTGEIYSVRPRADHRWLYLSGMQTDEVWLLKCFDSAEDGRARYTAHSAFVDPRTPADAPARYSIEARTVAFFGA